MNKSVLTAGLSALLAVSALSSAHAEDRFPRWYLGLHGGYTMMSDQDISGSTGATKGSFNSGYGYGGSVGYLPSSSAPLLNALRLEAEVTYHTNDVDKISTTAGKIGGHGNYSTTAYMANVFYDMPTNTQWMPYIGAGVGMAEVHLSSNSGAGNTDSSSNEFAYQALAGIGYAPTSIPNTVWSLGYRYLATSDASFGAAGGSIKTEYSTHNIEAGARFRF